SRSSSLIKLWRMSRCLSRARRTCHHVTGEGNQGSPAAAALMARTRKVTFLVPASATPGFLSQIAALQLALRRLPWTRWQADIVACIDGRLGLAGTFPPSRL